MIDSNLQKGEELRDATYNGKTKIVSAILKQYGKEISNEDKGEAFWLAYQSGDHEILTQLLSYDANAVHWWAVKNNHDEITLILLENNSHQLSKKNIDFALLRAAQKNNHPFAIILLNRFKEKFSKSAKGTALAWAESHNNNEMVKTILQLTGDEISSETKSYVLFQSAQGNHKIATTLLEYAGQEIPVDAFKKAFEKATQPLVIQAFKDYVIKNLKLKFNLFDIFFPKDLNSLVCEYAEHAAILTSEEFQQAISASVLTPSDVRKTKSQEATKPGSPATTLAPPAVILTASSFAAAPVVAPIAARAPLLFVQLTHKKRRAEWELFQDEKLHAPRKSARLLAKAKQAQHANGKEGLTSKRSCLRSGK